MWADRVLVAAAGLSGRPDVTLLTLTEEVAVRFAHRFAPTDRDYDSTSGRPRWHLQVQRVVETLFAEGLLAADPIRLTDAGSAEVDRARVRLAADEADTPAGGDAAPERGPRGPRRSAGRAALSSLASSRPRFVIPTPGSASVSRESGTCRCRSWRS